MAKNKNRREQTPKAGANKVRTMQVQELRRSGASGVHIGNADRPRKNWNDSRNWE